MKIEIQKEEWQNEAACRNPEVAGYFYPPSLSERKAERLIRERKAKAICYSCPVIDECLNYAINMRESHGIWGGLNENERRELIR